MKAGNAGEARYALDGYRLLYEYPETDEDGESIDVLPEPWP